jgi:hypothetical protein
MPLDSPYKISSNIMPMYNDRSKGRVDVSIRALADVDCEDDASIHTLANKSANQFIGLLLDCDSEMLVYGYDLCSEEWMRSRCVREKKESLKSHLRQRFQKPCEF